MNEPGINKEIDRYQLLLSEEEKQAVLTVVKTMAKSREDEVNIWEEKTFSEEMDRRLREYEEGSAGLRKFDEMKSEAIRSYNSKKS